MPEAIFRHQAGVLDVTPSVASLAGLVSFTPDGRAAVVVADLAASELGARYVEGIFDFASASGTLFDEGDRVYWDDTNNLAVNAGTAAARFIGVAVAAKINGALVVRVDLNKEAAGIDFSTLADSSTLTNSVAETVLATYTIPANSLRKGSVLDFLASVKSPTTNGTDTHQFRVRLGGLAGTVIADTTAIDLANNDVGVLRGQIVIRDDGATGSAVAASQSQMKTTSNPTVIDAATIDTTVAITLVVTGQHSVASAGNTSVCRQFVVDQR